MAGMDPAVKKETLYTAAWVILLSLLMEAVFLILGKWDLSVLLGNLGGAAVAVGSYYLLAVTVSKAVENGSPEEAAKRIKATASLRLAGSALLCVLLVAVFKTNVYATLIPLLFPRIGLAFRPAVDRRRGAGTAGQADTEGQPNAEGSDVID